MNLKYFDEFKQSLTQEDKEYISDINDENPNQLKVNLLDPNAGNELGAYIAGYSFKMNIRLLEKYHEWLSQQL